MILDDLANAQWEITDPGPGGAIPVERGGECAMSSNASDAETRTLAAPPYPGMDLFLTHISGTFTITVTCATAVNSSGNTVLTFTTNTGNWVWLHSVPDAAAATGAKWVLQADDSINLS